MSKKNKLKDLFRFKMGLISNILFRIEYNKDEMDYVRKCIDTAHEKGWSQVYLSSGWYFPLTNGAVRKLKRKGYSVTREENETLIILKGEN